MRKLIIWLVLLAVVGGPAAAIVLWWRDYYGGKIETHTVGVGDIVAGVTVSGTIESKQRQAVAAQLVAAVASVEVDRGQTVTRDAPLIRLDDSMVVAELAKAAASVELATQRLAEMEKGPRPQEIEKAEKDVTRAKAQREYARKHLDDVRTARGQGAATQAELNLAETRFASADAELGAAEAELALLKAGTREEHVNAAKAQLALAKAEKTRLEALRGRYTLRAAHDGVVTHKDVNVGEVVSPGQVLLWVHNLSDMEILAQVQEGQISGVEPGVQARVLTDSYPDTPLKAEVEKVLGRVDPERGTITVKLKFSEPPSVALKDGTTADIALIGESSAGAVRVPTEMVEGRGAAAAVWLRRGGRFVRQPVTTGIVDANGQWIEIKSGLKTGDVIRVP